MTTEISERKRALRAVLVAARARLTPEERAQRSQAICERVDALSLPPGARVVALYAGLGAEVDPGGLLRRLQARGLRCLFPRAVPGERRLDFCACEPFELVRGPLGAGEPPASARPVEPGEIDVLVMPGVGFSLQGLRLGRGGGYYDAAIGRSARALRVGVGFDLQLVPDLPREPHDAPLDAVVTESRTLLFPRSPTT